ncbi:MAG: GAF domain-containing protein [Anaerolineae bacterium]|nr:GAF domain-containing protein [Anaerolineae bacterium]
MQTWLERKVDALYEITRAINDSLNQQEVLTVLLERIVTELNYKAATLRLLDEERAQLELKAAYGLSQAYLAKGAVAVSKSQIDQKVLQGEWVMLADTQHDASFQYPEAAVREGLISMLAVPLTVRDRVIGVLHVYTAEPHTFRPAEQSFIAAIANLGAQAIQRTHLFEAFQRIAHLVNSTLKFEEVLTTLLLESVKELNVKAGSIRLLGAKDTLHLAAAYGLSETYLRKGVVQVAHSPIDQRVLQQPQPIAITELTPESGFQYPEEAQQEGIRSVLVLPLRVRDKGVGVLRLYSGQIRHFSAEEINFAAAVADLGALAIENAKLHEALKQRLEALKEDADGWYRFLALS